EAEDMPEDAKNLSFSQIAAFYDERMEEPSESFMSKVLDRVKAFTGNEKSNLKNDNMFGNKFPKMTALAKVAVANMTAELVQAANTEIAEAEIEGVTLVLDSELEAATTKVTGLETSVTEKDTEIQNLKNEIEALKKKPAASSTQPPADDDNIPDGKDGKEVEDFTTSTDKEYASIWGK